jgi:hypothetical protein
MTRALIMVHGPRVRAASVAEPLRPNVIIILADDLGYGDIGCSGSKVNRTPCDIVIPDIEAGRPDDRIMEAVEMCHGLSCELERP